CVSVAVGQAFDTFVSYTTLFRSLYENAQWITSFRQPSNKLFSGLVFGVADEVFVCRPAGFAVVGYAPPYSGSAVGCCDSGALGEAGGAHACTGVMCSQGSVSCST